MGKLDGRLAVVTGAAMGNGEGIAHVLAKHGAQVVLWDISDKVFETAESLQSEGHPSRPFKVDVRDFKACQAAADELITSQGKINILCNNAGVISFSVHCIVNHFRYYTRLCS